MAIDPSTEYVGKITAPDANYDYGSAKSVSTPTAQDGTPFSIKLLNDIFGFQQAILKATSIVPSGNADTQLASQYLQGISEMITNQNYGADASNTDDYVVTTRSRSSKYEEGIYLLKVTNTNTGAATVNYDSLGVKDIKLPDGSALSAGDLIAGRVIPMIYNGTEMRLLVFGGIVQILNTQTGAVATGANNVPYDDTIPQSGEANQFMTREITPTDVNNILKIDVVMNLSGANANNAIVAALFQDASANALGVVADFSEQNSKIKNLKFTHWMAAGTTSSTTFKALGGLDTGVGGTTTFNGVSGGRLFGGVLRSSIIITEYSQ